MIRLDALCARAEAFGDYAQVRQLLERRDEIRDQRSRLLRLQRRHNTLPVVRS